MFDRKKYKQLALVQLKNRWSIPCLTSLIYLILSVLLSATGVGWILTGTVFIAQLHIFMKLFRTTENPSFDDFFSGFENFLNSLLGILWYSLWFILWSLLFVIPGIVKSISYSMMFYIMAERPGIGPAKAMNISKILTAGHKTDVFVLMLSFCGWGILSLLSCGIGFIWLLPYMNMTLTNAYFDLKKSAFDRGILSPADFEKQ